jgi:hypothetical protein
MDGVARHGHYAHREPSMAPVGGNLAERHEALFLGYGAQARVWSKAG